MAHFWGSAVLSAPAYDVLADSGKILDLGKQLINFMVTTPVGMLFTVFIVAAVIGLMSKVFRSVPH